MFKASIIPDPAEFARLRQIRDEFLGYPFRRPSHPPPPPHVNLFFDAQRYRAVLSKEISHNEKRCENNVREAQLERERKVSQARRSASEQVEDLMKMKVSNPSDKLQQIYARQVIQHQGKL